MNISYSKTLKYLAIGLFFENFNKLERTIKSFYEKFFATSEKSGLLDFYYGVLLSKNYYINIIERKVELKEIIKYPKSKNYFSVLTINQIIKIDDEENIANNILKNTIQSLNQNIIFYRIIDICKKCIEMRNKLAHEICNLNFENKEIVEILSISYLSNNIFEEISNFDLKQADDATIAIISNIVYMQKAVDFIENTNLDNNSI